MVKGNDNQKDFKMKGFGKQHKSKEQNETNVFTNQSKEKVINQAIEFHIRGNISEAIKYYQYCINQGFYDHRVFSNYGVILKDLGKLKEAVLSQRKAIELRPDLAVPKANLGSILIELGKLKEAELSIRKAIELKPDLADAHSNLGVILKNLGKLKEAELSIRKAIELKPSFAEAHFNLGNIFTDLGKSQEAELSLRKAIELKPSYAEAHSNLGNILRNLGKLKEAELSLRKAIELNPSQAKAYFNLGSLLEETGNRIKSKEYWAKAIELRPDSETYIRHLALHLCLEKKYELAIQYLKKNSSDSCQSLYLGCLLSLDREKEFDLKYKELTKKGTINAEFGAIIEHARIIYKKDYKSPFCHKAINYIMVDKINEDLYSEDDCNKLISLLKSDQIIKKHQTTLFQGIQTSGDLFSLDYPFIRSMKKALKLKIESYKQNFINSGQGFIDNWPKDYKLRAWMIGMKNGGFLKPHNHEYGWITGSFYLKVPKRYNNNNAGSIAFSYQGPQYPSKDRIFNLKIKKIETRDICIFPSSLFHHTIPFQSKEERICFVFDLI
tara:strand:+ start:1977 stop:3638 length:1662 start_codon:yes stop_codon:yes gene_type:complete